MLLILHLVGHTDQISECVVYTDRHYFSGVRRCGAGSESLRGSAVVQCYCVTEVCVVHVANGRSREVVLSRRTKHVSLVVVLCIGYAEADSVAHFISSTENVASLFGGYVFARGISRVSLTCTNRLLGVCCVHAKAAIQRQAG